MKPRIPEKFHRLRGRLIVSCQAWEDDSFHGPGLMRRFAQAAIEGGAAGIRANGPCDVRDIKTALGPAVPVIAIQKRTLPEDGRVLITPAFEDAQALVEAGADAVALDCTARGKRHGALERIGQIVNQLKTPVAADIATLDEALAAQAAGAAFILTTMRGYTDETANIASFEPAFVEELVRNLAIPVIAEGRIWSPRQAQAALDAGAFAVVVGSAITRPRDITAYYARRLKPWGERKGCYLGLDIGGTNIKFGIVTPAGAVRNSGVEPTAIQGGRQAILDQVESIALRLFEDAKRQHLHPLATGISTAGWPDPATGRISYGTANLPDWSGADVVGAARRSVGGEMPVFIENDANALAVGEECCGAARGLANFLCVTLGTGVGAGCFANGSLVRGSRFRASSLGHVIIEPGGLECTCGQRGCLEPYANATALLRYAGKEYHSARRVLGAAHAGDENSRAAIHRLADHLARGLTLSIALLDPELIVLSGGLALDNPFLLDRLAEKIQVSLRVSALGYHGGVVGAAAVARAGLSA